MSLVKARPSPLYGTPSLTAVDIPVLLSDIAMVATIPSCTLPFASLLTPSV